jgi:hypothetical protein
MSILDMNFSLMTHYILHFSTNKVSYLKAFIIYWTAITVNKTGV